MTGNTIPANKYAPASKIIYILKLSMLMRPMSTKANGNYQKQHATNKMPAIFGTHFAY